MSDPKIIARRYKVIEEIGKGGMGRIYKVFDKKINENVALKLLKPEIAADKKSTRRFRNELKNARQISHKYVCRMYHIGTSKGTPYITMEYVSGEDLKSLITRMGQFTVGKAVYTAKQICEGLAEAHKSGVVHRDLKPQNIMIDEFGDVRIMNFGIARSFKAEGITEEGVMIGTPEYMSPEQADGKEIDHRSDIYSLGLILYEMLTGRLPFEGEIPLSLAVKHMGETLKGPSEFNAQIPQDLNGLILKCLEEDKEKRFQSAEDLLRELDKIDTGIPTTEKIVPRKRTLPYKKIAIKFDLKKLLVPFSAVLAVGVVAVLMWQVFFSGRSGSIPEGKPSLAVMTFKNNTGDENLDHWREMIAVSLIADLNQSKYIDVLSSERLFQIINELDQWGSQTYSSDVLNQVALQGGVNHILLGDYAKAGDTIRIQVNLMDARTEKTIATESEEGQGEEGVFAMVDGLTKKIKSNFRLTAEELAIDPDKKVSQITTSSPEAFKFYVEGRKYHLRGEFRQSIALMEKAVEIDPEFAMAYRSLAMSYDNLGLSQERKMHIQKAMDLSERLPEKELYLIQGDYYRETEETHDKAIEAYTKLLEIYPDDTTGNHNLGLIYESIEELDKALVHYEQSKKFNTEFAGTYFSIADVCMMQGAYDKAEEVLRNYINTFSENSWIHHYLAFNYINQGLYHFAQSEVDKSFTLDPTNFRSLYLKGVYHTLTGVFAEAKKDFEKLLEKKESNGRYLGLHGLANVCLIQGRFRESQKFLRRINELSQSFGAMWPESQARSILALQMIRSGRPREALKECDRAWSIGEQNTREDLLRLALHYKGLAYVALGSLTRALRTADQLKGFIEKWSHDKEIRRYHHLMGMIELERKNYSKAVEQLETALSLLPHQSSLWTEAHMMNNHALYMDSLALAYYRAGNVERALELYERIPSLSTGRLFFGDIYAKSFYMLGRIYQRKGENKKAEENYNKFLALWLDADRGIFEVSDAKRRLSRLNRQP